MLPLRRALSRGPEAQLLSSTQRFARSIVIQRRTTAPVALTSSHQFLQRRFVSLDAVDGKVEAAEDELPPAPPPPSAKDEESAEVTGGEESPVLETRQASLYFSSIFPIRLGKWDPRPWLANDFESRALLDQFPVLLKNINVHNFKLIDADYQVGKDGGVFVTFSYSIPPDSTPASVLNEVEESVRSAVKKEGLETWNSNFIFKWNMSKVWRVRGRPWRQDMSVFPSRVVKIEFEGPDVNQEALYDLLRPYGHIRSLTPPTPQPALTPRFSLVSYSRLSSAVIATSCLHGLSVPSTPPATVVSSSAPADAKAAGATGEVKLTRLSFSYESPLKGHVIRDWITNHPRLFLPLLAFLIGSLSYILFDPIREFAVSSRIMHTFNLDEYPILKSLQNWLHTVQNWLKDSTANPTNKITTDITTGGQTWRERQRAEKDLEGLISSMPSTFIIVQGASGTGKTALVQKVLDEQKKTYLVIDCASIAKQKTDQNMILELARTTGYWPIFGFLQSANTLIDLASQGLIGVKAGFATDTPTQMKAILETVTAALKKVSDYNKRSKQKALKHEQDSVVCEAAEIARAEKLKRIGFHDPRLSTIAGNGIMSTLGTGDERITPNDLSDPADEVFLYSVPPPSAQSSLTEESGPEDSLSYVDAESNTIEATPIVVLKNFASRGSKKPDLWKTIAEWSAGLVESGTAQVIVIADNASASKPLATALPSKPLNTIALADADRAASLAFVSDKVGRKESDLTPEEVSRIQHVGGRMSDLENLVYKVRSGGMSISEAVEDLTLRTSTELRKNMFGDDSEEAKALPWTRAEAWKLVKGLAGGQELSYSKLLLEFPFKGHEEQLKALEAAEFIYVSSVNGRPSFVRAGKPIFSYAFERLLKDDVFKASQEIDFNAVAIAKAEADVRSCEEELSKLTSVGLDIRKKSWFSGTDPLWLRAEWLLNKMGVSQKKINGLEQENALLMKNVIGKFR